MSSGRSEFVLVLTSVGKLYFIDDGSAFLFGLVLHSFIEMILYRWSHRRIYHLIFVVLMMNICNWLLYMSLQGGFIGYRCS